MNQFISDYLKKLRRVSSDEDVKELYHWFWDNQTEIKRTAEAINRELGLVGEYALQPDLPCLTIGARTGLLFLLVNPGWSEGNRKAEDYCRKSKNAYVDLMFNWFTRSPQILAERIRYTANMISFIGVLRDGPVRLGNPKTAEERWQLAQASKLIGHWELFPFHSAKDGLTKCTSHYPWLFLCIKESILAALRFQPEMLFVMSKDGWDILRNDILQNQHWRDTEIGKPATRLSYCAIAGKTRNTEVLGIPRQVLSSHRICTNQELFHLVSRLRQGYPDLPWKSSKAGASLSDMATNRPRSRSEPIQSPAAPETVTQIPTPVDAAGWGLTFGSAPGTDAMRINCQLCEVPKTIAAICAGTALDFWGPTPVSAARAREHLKWHWEGDSGARPERRGSRTLVRGLMNPSPGQYCLPVSMKPSSPAPNLSASMKQKP